LRLSPNFNDDSLKLKNYRVYESEDMRVEKFRYSD